jgi:ribose-phosphate pyrophosphokinase
MPLFQTGALHAGEAPNTFHRRLLSEYNAEWTLSTYCDFDAICGTIDRLAASVAKAKGSASDKNVAEPDEKLSQALFAQLRESFARVRAHLARVEAGAVARLNALNSGSVESIFTEGRGATSSVAQLFFLLLDIERYRRLNAEAFHRLLEAAFERCAMGSLVLQQKLLQADRIIAASNLCVAGLNTDASIEAVASVFGTAFGLTYEAAVSELRLLRAQDIACRHRVMPLKSALYYAEKSAYRHRAGAYSTRIVAGSTNPGLVSDMAHILRCGIVDAKVANFANGEVSISVNEPLRGEDVFIVQPVAATKALSLSGALTQLLLMIQTAKLASCARVTAVVPYLPYSGRAAEGALVGELFAAVKCDRVVTMDLVRNQAEGYFLNTPVEILTARVELARYVMSRFKAEHHPCDNLVVVAPDGDNVNLARAFADDLMRQGGLDRTKQFVPVATAVKRIANGSSTPVAAAAAGGHVSLSPAAGSLSPGLSPRSRHIDPFQAVKGAQIDFVGAVEGRVCIIVDNAIDEGVKVAAVARHVRSLGATRILAVVTHGIFSGDGANIVAESDIDEVIVTDTLDVLPLLADPRLAKKLRVLPVAPLLAGAIERVHSDTGKSILLDR